VVDVPAACGRRLAASLQATRPLTPGSSWPTTARCSSSSRSLWRSARPTWPRTRWGLGAQAGEGRLREVFEQAGFTRFRKVAETPMNLIIEAKA
jgi:hypothetical protein